jgi:hypothetical protein
MVAILGGPYNDNNDQMLSILHALICAILHTHTHTLRYEKGSKSIRENTRWKIRGLTDQLNK